MNAIVVLLAAGFIANVFAQDVTIDEQMSVTRVIVNVRVLDYQNQPIENLTADNFAINLQGKRHPVLTCQWVDDDNPPRVADYDYSSEDVLDDPDRTYIAEDIRHPYWEDEPINAQDWVPDGKLVVLFFQGNLDGAFKPHLLRLSKLAKRFVRESLAGDYVAVFSFYSHLTMVSDFTREEELIYDAIRTATRTSKRGNVAGEPFPSLYEYFDEDAAAEVWTVHGAMTMIGKTLANLPGPKSVLYFGWGLPDPGLALLVDQPPEMSEVVDAMNDSSTAVFTMDINKGPHNHVGAMVQLSNMTGGFYAQPYGLPRREFDKLARTLNGYYILSFEKPELSGSRTNWRQPIRIDLVGHKGTILVRAPYNQH